MKLQSFERELKGNWILKGNSMMADDVCIRIEELIEKHLVEIYSDNSGWFKLYQDPSDNRYWELLFPESEMNGGGAPTLSNISEEVAKKKYRI